MIAKSKYECVGKEETNNNKPVMIHNYLYQKKISMLGMSSNNMSRGVFILSLIKTQRILKKTENQEIFFPQ